MEPILLIDFGSTYTKITAVDVKNHLLLGTAVSFTTVETDIAEGLAAAAAQLEKKLGKINFSKRLACSSAAGGLKMVACGLVPELTAKAAKLASLGAGAKLVGLYSYELTEDDIQEILHTAPDILLLTGGTDGGNAKCIVHNAQMLASAPCEFPIIVAGNRSCKVQLARILEKKQTFFTENVMPALETLNIEPTRQKIRDIFLEQIIKAKGLSGISELIGGILMPTPAAVLSALELLAKGFEDEPGLGDLMAIDVGGATTDIYSIADGMPKSDNVIFKGLPEPFSKRTVEGDIGMRYTADGTIGAAGVSKAAAIAGAEQSEIYEYVSTVKSRAEYLPKNRREQTLDFMLAALAIETATLRHAGTLEEVYTVHGKAFIQSGKDLTNVGKIIMTGGALIHAERKPELNEYAMFSDAHPESLRPKQASCLYDESYIIAAMGLLGQYSPIAALRLMKSHLKPVLT